MNKIWTQTLCELKEQGKIILFEIEPSQYHESYGRYAFTTPGIEEWLRMNDPHVKPAKYWGGIIHALYFTLNDIDIGEEDNPTRIGFKVNIYSGDDGFRDNIKNELRDYLNKKLKSEYHSTDRGYCMYPTQQTVDERLVDLVFNVVLPNVEKMIRKLK